MSSLHSQGVSAAKPRAGPPLALARTDWVRPPEPPAPSVSPRLERASPLRGLRERTRPARRRLALLVRRSTPRRETWEAARRHGLDFSRRAIACCTATARTVEGHRARLQDAGADRARRARAWAARVAPLANDSLRTGAERLQAAWVLRPRASVWVIGGCVLLAASILSNAGRQFEGGRRSLEGSAASVASPSSSERELPRPERRVPEPVSAAAPAAVVQLRVNAMPWAIVTVDGRSLGSTPISVNVSPGLHRVRVELSDGRTIEEEVVVGEEGSQLAFQ